MSKRVGYITIIFLFSVFFLGCVSTLREYQPKSSEQEAIKMFLIKYEKAWNRHDISGISAAWHDNATKIMSGAEQRIVNKRQYVNGFPKKFKAFPTIRFGAPKINIGKNKAVVEVPCSTPGGVTFLFTFHMVRENNRWFFMTQEFSF